MQSYKRIDVDEIRRSFPIQSFLQIRGVNVRRSGGGYLCRCHLGGHDDKHPSFSIKGDRWVCWSHPGGEMKGDIIDLIMIMYGDNFVDAVKRLRGGML